MSYEFNLICLGLAISIAWVWMTDGQEIKDALYKRRVAREEKLKCKEKRKHKNTQTIYPLPPNTVFPPMQFKDEHERQLRLAQYELSQQIKDKQELYVKDLDELARQYRMRMGFEPDDSSVTVRLPKAHDTAIRPKPNQSSRETIGE